ncbi:MAG: NADH-quinone oxidoreductase subunit H [Dehalococcoidia bacterium]|nr:NADH-quinone oxidoreductase subunit H [Dehalococcoidia bacterium]
MSLLGENVWLNGLVIVIGTAVLVLVGAFFGMLYRGVDRKLVARMQGRVGPPIAQPFRDVQKLLMKENIIPSGATPWLFNAAPFLALISTGSLLLFIPLFGQPALLGRYGDVILVLYLLIIPSLAFVLGGFASSSPYATVGAQREMIIMMSYEAPLAVVVLGIAWRIGHVTDAANPFLMSTIAQYPIWSLLGPVGVIGALLMLLTLVVVTVGEAAKVPFDVAEAETEIAGGLLVEYSGRNLSLFYLSDVIKAFAMVSLLVALFIPYNLSPALGITAAPAAGIVDALFFLVKVLVVMFFSISLIRAGMARFKISQATSVYLMAMTAAALVGMFLVWVDARIWV